MYNATAIKAGMIGLLGWRQNNDPSGTQLAGLLSSTSGMYYNDFHPLLTAENVASIAPSFDLFTYPAWSGTTTYQTGTVATKSSVKYRALQPGVNKDPETEWDYWEVYEPFTAWLKEKTEAGIIATVEEWAGVKFKDKTARNLLSRDVLFNGAIGDEKDVNGGKLVGMEFVPLRSRNAVSSIHQIGVHFASDCEFTIYLLKSGQVFPVASQAVTYARTEGVKWVTVDWEIEGNGAYFVAYDQTQTGVQSYNGVQDFNHIAGGATQFPCNEWIRARSFQTELVQAGGIGTATVETDFIIGTQAFDREGVAYLVDTNFGLNFRFSVKCDYTVFILEQKALFATAVGYRVASALLRELAYNPDARVNRLVPDTDRVLYEIDGRPTQTPGELPTGLQSKYTAAMNAIKFDLTNIDPHCLPCKNSGIIYGSI